MKKYRLTYAPEPGQSSAIKLGLGTLGRIAIKSGESHEISLPDLLAGQVSAMKGFALEGQASAPAVQVKPKTTKKAKVEDVA